MIVEWIVRGKPTVIGICSGAVAGLVAITPASGFVGPMGAFVIGIAAGIVCYWGCTGLKHFFGYDDALDAFGVHAVGGATGAILTGVFAVAAYGGTAGLIEGNPGQVLNQLVGVGSRVHLRRDSDPDHPESRRHGHRVAGERGRRARRPRSRSAWRDDPVVNELRSGRQTRHGLTLWRPWHQPGPLFLSADFLCPLNASALGAYSSAPGNRLALGQKTRCRSDETTCNWTRAALSGYANFLLFKISIVHGGNAWSATVLLLQPSPRSALPAADGAYAQEYGQDRLHFADDRAAAIDR